MSFQAEATINHFSHVHPMQLYDNHQDQFTQNLCSGCKLEAKGRIYTCFSCNYFLHIKCAKMPMQINHPFHKDHVFTLLYRPPYADGLFNCDACKKKGDGFAYHCDVCEIDLHILCAVAPLSIKHQSHMNHQLNITFSPPYANKIFNCDVCNTPGSDHWLYRCEICNFDVHLECIQAELQVQQPGITSRSLIQAPQVLNHRPQHTATGVPGITSRSPIQAPQALNHQPFRPQHTATGIPTENFMPNSNNFNQATHAPVFMPFGPRPNVSTDDLLALQLLQTLSNNNSSQSIFSQYFLQTLMAGSVGGGLGGPGAGVGGVRDDLTGLQQLYQLFSGINAGGAASGLGGGVGGNLAGMQHLYQLYSGISAGGLSGPAGGVGSGGVTGFDILGSAGGSQNIFQPQMGDSGGEPLNILQALVAGGGNGLNIFGGNGGSSILTGGLDALIGLLGGFSL